MPIRLNYRRNTGATLAETVLALALIASIGVAGIRAYGGNLRTSVATSADAIEAAGEIITSDYERRRLHDTIPRGAGKS